MQDKSGTASVGLSAVRGIGGKSEAATARSSAARGIKGNSEAATARSSIARCVQGKPEAATARPSVARGIGSNSEAATARQSFARDTGGKSEAATARSSVARGIQSESETATARSSAAKKQSEDDSAMELEILNCATTYFLNGEIPPTESLQATIAEAVEAASTNYGVAEAIDWADGFEFPQDMLDSDLRCFRAAQLDFETMVRRRLKIINENRLNPARVNMLRVDNPERHLLLDLAGGMRVPRPDGFSPNGKSLLSPLRPSYLKVAGAVNKMIAGIVTERLGFLLPKALAIRTIANLHLCTAHWTPKKGKKSGRPIGDLTFVDGMALNSDETTASSELFYGVIVHPTIEIIIKMILRFWEQCEGPKTIQHWRRLRIWKMDLRGAYTLLSFRPEDAGLFGMELTGDLIYLQICGIFGWSSTPAAFQVVTRALKWEFKSLIKSYTEM